MPTPAQNSDNIIREAGRALAMQRAGGLHRRAPIGRGSARLRRQHAGAKLVRIAIAAFAILAGVSIVGSIIGGIGFTGVVITGAVLAGAAFVLGRYPRMKIPERADLQTENVRQLVGQTELWLESQRSALPPPAAKMVTYIGQQLDGLELQLADVDPKHPAAGQIRKLVGEDLPDMVAGYRKIPEHLRYEDSAGATPTKQLLDGLDVISHEIDSVTRQLAQGSLDDLAIRSRYLEYKYGDGDAAASPQKQISG